MRMTHIVEIGYSQFVAGTQKVAWREGLILPGSFASPDNSFNMPDTMPDAHFCPIVIGPHVSAAVGSLPSFGCQAF